jgi:hypothetical protein
MKEKPAASAVGESGGAGTTMAVGAAPRGSVEMPITTAEEEGSRDIVNESITVAWPGWRFWRRVERARVVAVCGIGGGKEIVWVLSMTKKDADASKEMVMVPTVVWWPGSSGLAALLMMIAVLDGATLIRPKPGIVATGFDIAVRALVEVLAGSWFVVLGCPTGVWGSLVLSGKAGGFLVAGCGFPVAVCTGSGPIVGPKLFIV